jgi:hypothetical protein
MQKASGYRLIAMIAAVTATGCATGAMAQISNVQSTTTATQTLDGTPQMLPSPVPSPNYDNGGPGGAGYSASANITADSIFFQAGSMAAGRLNSATSGVTVSFDVTGQSDTNITKVKSTIFESNFGFYVGSFTDFVDPDTSELVEGCSGANLPNCAPTVFTPGFSGFAAPGDTTPPITLASTEFTFEILQDGAIVRTLGGRLDAVKDGGGVTFVKSGGFNELESVLGNFVQFESPGNEDKIYAFSWERTDFTADLLNAIGLGETSTISYRISTASYNYATPAGLPPSSNLIVAFSCFADPVGRGGTSGAIFTIPGFGASTCNDYSGNSEISAYSIKIPVINGDTIDFTAPNGAIPEPDTWAMLIIGFGLVGLSMRRGKKPQAVPATA